MQTLEMINIKLDAIIEEQHNHQLNSKNIEKDEKTLQDLEKRIQKIESQLKKEEKDVEKLKSISFSNFFHTMMSQKDEKLRQEEKEVMEVKVTLDQLHYDYKQTQDHKIYLTSLLKDINAINKVYDRLFNEKLEFLKLNFSHTYELIIANSKKIEDYKRSQKEVTEAIIAGNNCFNQITVIQGSLQSAANWGTYDMLGGGMLSTMAKRSHMNDAQEEMQRFQRTLSIFNKELSDVADTVIMELQLNGFLDMADFFFDGFFVDWAVQDKINNARNQVNQLQGKINTIVSQLQNELTSFKREIKILELKNIDLVITN